MQRVGAQASGGSVPFHRGAAYGVALNVEVQSAERGRERRKIFMDQDGKCQPHILSVFHLPATVVWLGSGI